MLGLQWNKAKYDQLFMKRIAPRATGLIGAVEWLTKKGNSTLAFWASQKRLFVDAWLMEHLGLHTNAD